MGFLGPVTRLGEHLVRPHDIEVLTADSAGAVPATVRRLVRVGFQVRAELQLATAPGQTSRDRIRARTARTSDTAVQLTRGQADALDLQVGSRVWLRPSQHASVLAAR